MQVYGKLLVGSALKIQNGTGFPLYTSWQIIDIDWSRSLAVQAGLQSLFRHLTLSLLRSSQFI